MAFGTSQSNWIIYQEQFWAGVTEVQQQNVDAFNAASNGCIQLVSQMKKGEYEQQAFLQKISGLISRRDLNSTSGATDIAMTTDEFVSVKINRTIGPVAQTLDSWRKLGADAATMSFLLGQQVAGDIQADYLNSALRAVRASITSVTAMNYNGTAGNMTFARLLAGLALFGDASQRLVCLVMHSKPFFDLVSDGLSNYKIDTVAGAMIAGGFMVEASPATMGRPVIVTDSAALVTSGSPNTYHTLALVTGACSVTESESRQIVSDLITGYDQLFMRVQGEYAFNVGVKGMQWDITSGSSNPSDATLLTNTNWDQIAADDKNTAGVRIYTH